MNIFKLFCVDKFLFEDLPYWKKVKNHHFYFSKNCKNPEEISKILLNQADFDIKVFRTRRRRRVYLARTADGSGVLCKQIFLSRHKKNCFRVKDFAYNEVRRTQDFSSCPYPVPEIYGYYEKRICGIPVECGLFMSFLEGFEQVTPDDYEKVNEVIVKLFQSGHFHKDLTTQNVLIKRSSGEIALCDLDDSAIVEPGKFRTLLMLGGNFLYAVGFRFPEKATDDYKQKFISSLYGKLPDQSICSFDKFKQLILEISRYEIGQTIPETVFDGTDF